MTELQQTELTLFEKFIEVCDRLQLPYFMVCGTALGTVKYQGFIPWDDDIDVGMPREAYEEFIRKAPVYLEAPYFLQNYRSDPNFPAIYSKLRNSDTTYIEKSVAKLDINHGVYIDIFPLDGYPQNPSEQRKLERKKRMYSLQAQTAFDLPRSIKARVLTGFLKLLGYHRRTAKIMQKYSDLVAGYTIERSSLICNHGNWQGKLEYAPKEQYGEGAYAEFEGLRVRIPERYDEYLTQKYGDWRTELPVEQQIGHHYYEMCDLNRSYTDYVGRAR